MRKLLLGLISLSLMPLLSSCATSQVVTTTRVCPPQTLTQSRPLPEWNGRTNGDLLQWALDAAEVIKSHNLDKQAISQFCQP
jgi:hypothetical protein